ncbi:ABC transporter substrate-binding protein [Phormidesmis sp. 146-33]
MVKKLWRFSLGEWLRGLMLFGLCCILAVSCSRSTPQNRSDTGRITLGTTAKVSTIDPADAYNIFSGNLLYNLGDRLYSYQLGTTKLEPQLATALPTVSKDGLTYKIPLRQGVVFHDGAAFDAKAMTFSLERFMKNGGSPAFLLSGTVDSIQPTGTYELTIKLKKPFAAFPSLLAFSGACAVSPKAYEIGENKFKPKEFVGTGAYKLVRYGTDSMQLEAFDRYWGGKPKNRGIDIQFFSSPANLFNAFRTGAVDVAYQGLALEQIRNLRESKADKGWQIVEEAGSGIDYLSLNMQSPPLDKLEVRQAIAAIVDRPLLQSRVFQGQIDPLYSLIPATLAEQKPVFEQYGDRNVQKASELLQKAGYSESNPLKVEFWYRSNLPNDQLAAMTMRAIVQKYLGKIMQIDLNSIESTMAYKNLDKGVYPIFLLDWTPDFLDSDNYIYPFLECTKGSAEKGCEEGQSFSQGSFYYSQEANELIDRSRQELNFTSRKKLFGQLQDILAKDVPFVPLWQNKDFLFAQKNVQGASLQATQKVPLWMLRKS